MNYFLKIFLVLMIMIATSFGQSGLSVHGYLNQAYAFTDGNQIFGIPKEGTTDYRNLALQFRYDINESSNFVIQFSHKRAGLNPLMAIEEDVRLDWGYFEYHFNDEFSARVGKIQIPIGNYNEFRDVGVLLPFYSVPFSPYGDGNYMSETVDGIVLSYNLELNENWNFAFSLYGGHWNWLEWQHPFFGDDIQLGEITIDNGFGGQVRIGTPVDGLEVGFGGQYIEPSGGISFSNTGFFGSQTEMLNYYAFFKADFEHFFIGSDIVSGYFLDYSLVPIMSNSQAGVHIFEKLDLNIQYEFFILNNVKAPASILPNAGLQDTNYNTDLALGLKYNFSSNFVFKVETHWNEGYFVEDKKTTSFLDDPLKTQYTIISIATSF